MVGMSMGELAEKLAVTRETISRVLRELEEDGKVEYIHKNRGKVRVIDPEQFRWDHEVDKISTRTDIMF